ncbi:hypothetical protein C0Q70_01851 [Pomacea canaliculata]|uniref:Uncharacterized protein n=1 Tax=Pomacea canaliculata TaxID=400727 RepID=A0A2T7Q0M8_POMCA|nr:hypothetical protein C0Q70_01851 [Pomacea canaliculata]
MGGRLAKIGTSLIPPSCVTDAGITWYELHAHRNMRRRESVNELQTRDLTPRPMRTRRYGAQTEERCV